jgi:myo-inositol 2-dehydrogenase / D-chiro-inositol 1-dehydrogenase
MHDQDISPQIEQQFAYSRRRFLGGATVAAAAPLLAGAAGMAAQQPAAESKPEKPKRRIKLGVVGCGTRSRFVLQFFRPFGGYDIHAVTDYFPEAAERIGEVCGVDPSRRFSGLGGYKKVFESGVEAVLLLVPPYFLPDYASAAVDAGLHVYMAKPVAVDVPGCMRVAAAAKKATQNKRAFLVDLQMQTDPVNIEIANRIREEGVDKLARICTRGSFGGHVDPPKTATIESRLRDNVWDCDIALGGDYILCFDIHILHAALWVLGQRPIAATGRSRICRTDPHGDAHDVCAVIFEYANGLIHEHCGQALPTGDENELACRLYSETTHAMIVYERGAHFHHRREKPYDAVVEGLYVGGVKRNLATFHQNVTEGQFENGTVPLAVDACLTAILGREAASRGKRLTMEEVLKENKRIELDLSGLKA